MRINRLTEIMVILLNNNGSTAKELAYKFGVSTRTIYRDIDILSSSGVPVYMTKGNGGGIFILEGYSINKTILNDEDKMGLRVALEALSSISYSNLEETINKLGFTRNDSNLDDWIEIDFSRWGGNIYEKDKFNNIKLAIKNSKIIEFEYIDSNGKDTNRKVEPIKLIYKGQTWYLFGYCLNRKDTRLFRMTRIKDMVLLDENFKSRDLDKFSISDIDKNIQNIISLKLKVRKEALHRIYDELTNKFIENSEGIYEVNIELPENEWLYGYILSFGNLIEVIEPYYVREIVLKKILELKDIYK